MEKGLIKNKIKDLSFKIKSLNFLNLAYLMLIFFSIALTLIYGEYANANDGQFSNGVNKYGFIFFSLAIFILDFFILFIGFRSKLIKFDKKINIAFIFIFLIFVYFTLLTFLKDYSHLYFYNEFDPSKNIYPRITRLDKCISVSQVFFGLILYFIVFNLIKEFKDIKNFIVKILFICNITIAFSAIIYSFIFEANDYLSIIQNPSFFTKRGLDNSGVRIQSFFQVTNVFGHLLFLAILSNTLFMITHKKYYLIILNFIFYFFIFFSGSRTAFLGSSLVLILLYFYGLYRSFYKNKLLFTILLSLTTFIFIYLFLDTFLIKNFVIKEIVNNDGGNNVVYYSILDLFTLFFKKIGERFSIIEIGYSIYNLNDIIFGVGYNLNDLILRSYQNIGGYFVNYHNGYIEWFSVGGIVSIIIYLVVFIIIFKKMNFLIKNNKEYLKDIMLFFIILIPYMVYMFSEAFPIFYITTGGIDITLLLFSNIISKTNLANKELFNLKIVKNDGKRRLIAFKYGEENF